VHASQRVREVSTWSVSSDWMHASAKVPGAQSARYPGLLPRFLLLGGVGIFLEVACLVVSPLWALVGFLVLGGRLEAPRSKEPWFSLPQRGRSRLTSSSTGRRPVKQPGQAHEDHQPDLRVGTVVSGRIWTPFDRAQKASSVSRLETELKHGYAQAT
jgi:hypothetical protein